MNYFFVEERREKRGGSYFGTNEVLRSIDPLFEEYVVVRLVGDKEVLGLLVSVDNERDSNKLIKFSEIMKNYVCYAIDSKGEATCLTTGEKCNMEFRVKRRVGHILFAGLVMCRSGFPELSELYKGTFDSD